ncbi:MAG: PEP-CTERM sorting domain-containing protein [Phycisphaerales bacterium]|nr:PEP-CTERM sorting domain-containing protein [Phycisphaerales bacterium]
MKRILCAIVVTMAAAVTSVANAAVTFSNVVFGGSLPAPTAETSSHSIDFFFDQAEVGDPTDPVRQGNVTIMYEATSSVGLTQDLLVLSLLGALQGSGVIVFSETVTDLTSPNPDIIASHNVVLNANDQLPHVANLVFSRPSTHVKVKKEIVLSATDTQGFDLSHVGLIEQTFREIPVPEPMTALLLGLAGLGLRRR